MAVLKVLALVQVLTFFLLGYFIHFRKNAISSTVLRKTINPVIRMKNAPACRNVGLVMGI